MLSKPNWGCGTPSIWPKWYINGGGDPVTILIILRGGPSSKNSGVGQAPSQKGIHECFD